MQANFTIPTGVNNYRFVVQYNSTISFTPLLQYVSVNRFATSTRYYANIINLVRDREYSISVRFEVSFSVCSPYYYRYTYMPGSYSDPITVRTNDTGITLTLVCSAWVLSEKMLYSQNWIDLYFNKAYWQDPPSPLSPQNQSS